MDHDSERYEIREQIGSGTMGTVYRAWDRETRREVALKWLPRPDAEDLFRLKHEFRSLAEIVHPHLIRLYELVAEGPRCFFTAELIAGGRELTAWTMQFLPEAREAAIRGAFRQLARGLSALHAAHKIHRDLKPSNILVDASSRLVLLDFGLVSNLDADTREESPGSLIGTILYMSPEQSRGAPLTPASDWYSVGVLLYECLAGISPLAEAPRLALADRRWLRIPDLAERTPGVPSDLAELAMALLAFEPTDRPPVDQILSVLDPGAPVTPAARTDEAPPFVGRIVELSRLQFSYAAARAGEPAVTTISGPSGIGKTALVERFLATLAPKEALILRARCHPREDVPFAALDQAIDDLACHLLERPHERNESLVPRNLEALLTVFPVLGRVGLQAEPTHGVAEPHLMRRRAFDALREILARLAAERPVIAWLEDLQWADADSEPLLRALLTPPGIPAVLWILTQQDDEGTKSRMRQLFDELPGIVGEATLDAISLGPLDARQSRELIDALGPDTSLDSNRVATLAEEGDGSPFLLTELAQAASRMATTDPAHTRLDYASLLGARLGELSPPARNLVETLAVVSSPIDRRTALESAGLVDFDPDLLDRLARARLLRIASGRTGDLEIYHTRIRKTVAAGLPAAVQRERHAAIAATLVRRKSEDLRALFEHHRGAGLREDAAGYAYRAAEQAAGLLAFDDAAQMFGTALELGVDVIDRARALRGMAEALANAGRGCDAARAFTLAADHAARQGQAEAATGMRCSAAEQYLVSGHLHEGVETLQPLLSQFGQRYPRTSGAAMGATFASLPTLAWRYLKPAPENSRRDDVDALLAIDACHTAAKGLVLVDPARAAYFSIRSLLASLESGDPVRRGRAYCVVGAAIVPLGGPLGVWGRRMLERADRLARRTENPYLEGMVAISQAQVSCVAGRWSEMLRLCDEGTTSLRSRCLGVRWECDVGSMAALRALEELGRITELEQRVAVLLEEALALDDVYAEVTFRLNRAFWAIARGETGRARDEARESLSRWTGEGFQLQHLYELRVEAFCDLYDGDVDAAWVRVNSAWPAIRRSNLLSHVLLRGDALEMLARVAVSPATRAPARKKTTLRTARKAAQGLTRIGRPDTRARALLIEAGIARRQGDVARAQALAESAAAIFASVEMPLHRAQALLCADPEIGGPVYRTIREEAKAEVMARGVVDPERWIRVVAPGFDDRVGN